MYNSLLFFFIIIIKSTTPLLLPKLLNKELVDRLVSERVRVLQVQPMAGTRHNRSGNVGAGERLLGLGRDAAALRRAIQAAAAAERHVALAGDDEDGAREVVQAAGLAADSQQLADGHGLAGRRGEGQDLRVEGAGGEEVGLHAGRVAGGQVAVGVRGGQGGVGLDVDEVAAELEEGQEAAVLREAGQGDAVRDGRVHGGQRVRVRAAEAVADVHDLLELVVDALEAAFAQLLSQGAQAVDLEQGLDLLDGVAVGGLGDAQTVPGEGREAVVVGGYGAVGVVAAVERQVPVAPVEADAVGEDLHGLGLLVLARHAVGGGELIVAADGLVLFEELGGVVGALLGVVQDEVCDFNVVLGRFVVEDSVSGGELDGYSQVGAVHG
jgi:hypothetical protein